MSQLSEIIEAIEEIPLDNWLPYNEVVLIKSGNMYYPQAGSSAYYTIKNEITILVCKKGIADHYYFVVDEVYVDTPTSPAAYIYKKLNDRSFNAWKQHQELICKKQRLLSITERGSMIRRVFNKIVNK